VFGDTHIPEMVARARLADEVVIDRVLMKESPGVTTADREIITAACRASAESKIVITHGTSVMVETAQTLARAALSSGKTIVLTGAMVPYSFGAASTEIAQLLHQHGFGQITRFGPDQARGAYFPGPADVEIAGVQRLIAAIVAPTRTPRKCSCLR
jgi:hypothetical protein